MSTGYSLVQHLEFLLSYAYFVLHFPAAFIWLLQTLRVLAIGYAGYRGWLIAKLFKSHN